MMPNPLPSAGVPQVALVADPNADVLELYSDILIPRHYVVEHAISGPDALAKAIANPPDVVIIDTQLPIIDGYTVCGLLREDPITRHVPIVVITADGRQREVDRARRAGAASVLVKPCLPENLLEALQQLRDEQARSHDGATSSAASAVAA